ncbi:MAG TPA: hypothetical protein DDY21_00060 [Candidatus Moranbacteria bacterium]|nr:hypothetical protein [Candidatus Moranbacteria bacterium]
MEKEITILGEFDGQSMIADGKKYPIPQNYASKSMLVEGDKLKMVINNGKFSYKQIGSVPRIRLIMKIERIDGKLRAVNENTPYDILYATISYYDIQEGDEVIGMIPEFKNANYVAVEGVIKPN